MPPLFNSNFSSSLLSHPEVVDKSRDESFGPNSWSCHTHDGNFEATEDVPQPTSCCSLTIFTFHSCGGGRSTSTLRTCCDGLQIGLQRGFRNHNSINRGQQCQNNALYHVEERTTVVVIMYIHILWPITKARQRRNDTHLSWLQQY